MKDSHPYTTIALHRDLLPDLDRLVGAALARGERHHGRAASRGTVVSDLVREAARALREAPPASATPGAPAAPQRPPGPHGEAA